MKKLVTAELMKRLDELASSEYKIKSLDLMNAAGLKVFEKIKQYEKELKGKKVAVVCGKGNNGGDGLLVAEHLFEAGADVKVIVLSLKSKISADSKKIHTRVSKKIKDIKFETKKYDENFFDGVEIIVDAIFGTGFNANPEDLFFDIIKGINDSKATVYAVDIPSGIHGTTGNCEDIAVLADRTITLGFPKVGLYINDGYTHSGKVDIVDIGIPKELDDEIQDTRMLTELSDVKGLIKERSLSSDKKDFGKVFNFSGSLPMPGAAVLSSTAALKTGAGSIKLGVPMNICASIIAAHPEITTIPLAYAQPGYTSINAEKDVMKGFKWCDVCLVGPGLSVHPETRKVAKKLFMKFDHKPVVLDADALNMIADHPETFPRASGQKQLVITPHNSEMARLAETSKEMLLLDRVGVIVKKAMEWNCHIILKGTPTLIAFPNGNIHIHVNKNPGLAVGGMGDVLSGILVSLLGQKYTMTESIYLGLYIHTVASELAREKYGEVGMIPSDLVKEIPNAIEKIKSL